MIDKFFTALIELFRAVTAAFGWKKDRDTQQADQRQAAINAAEHHSAPPKE